MTSDAGGLAGDERIRSAARYLVVGVLSFGIDVGTLAVSLHVLHAPVWLATSAGFWTSFVVNFLLSRHWTFGAGAGARGGQLIRYSILVAVNYLITLVAVLALHRMGVDVIVARTATLIVLTVWTFFAYRHWVFKEKGEAS